MAIAQLDIEQPGALARHLERSGRVRRGEILEVKPLFGGVSCRVMLVELRSGDSWVVKQALPKLRVADDWFADPARIHREALGLAAIARLCPGKVPELLFEDRPAMLLAMRAVPQPHETLKALLMRGSATPTEFAAFGKMLGQVHRRSAATLETLEPELSRTDVFVTLRVEPYYLVAARRVPEAATMLRKLAIDLADTRRALVHGDYSPKNVLVHAGQLVLLDCEVAHVGEPAFDVGFALAHLLSKAHHLVLQREELHAGALTYWRSYIAALGDVSWAGKAHEARAVRHTLGCLLARVAGRSPLEYLDADERGRQRAVCVTLAVSPPPTVEDLASSFIDGIA